MTHSGLQWGPIHVPVGCGHAANLTCRVVCVRSELATLEATRQGALPYTNPSSLLQREQMELDDEDTWRPLSRLWGEVDTGRGPAGGEHGEGMRTCNSSRQSAFDGKLLHSMPLVAHRVAVAPSMAPAPAPVPTPMPMPVPVPVPVLPQHRFAVGDRVRCKTGERLWQKGRVTHVNYRESAWPPSKAAPYRIELDMGQVIVAPEDRADRIRAE